ncbi:MAG: energy transducer TonB [Candidatus Eremiobacteraeota bacterium]|nr:energy transducer TonB [Candidatus Eremiobacteraeota bacterium]
MTFRTIAFLAVGAFAIFGCRAAARADQIFCAANVAYLTPATPHAVSDTTYDVVLRTFGKGEITHVKLAILEQNREYEVDVPALSKAQITDDITGLRVDQFRPLALRFSKPVGVQGIWIEELGDDHGNGATCISNPSVPPPAQTPKDDKYARSLARLDKFARTDPLAVSVPVQARIAFTMPENCEKSYVDVTPAPVVVPEYPEAAKGAGVPEVTVIVRLSILADGEIDGVAIVQSSGNAPIDAAALNAARQSKYSPKKLNCIPFAGIYLFRATFDPN